MLQKLLFFFSLLVLLEAESFKDFVNNDANAFATDKKNDDIEQKKDA